MSKAVTLFFRLSVSIFIHSFHFQIFQRDSYIFELSNSEIAHVTRRSYIVNITSAIISIYGSVV